MSLGYLGSKSRILPFLQRLMSPLLHPKSVFGDLFAGTGVVGKTFQHHVKSVIASDLELYSYVINKAHLQTSYTNKLAKIIETLNTQRPRCNGLIWQHFAPSKGNVQQRMFFTVENAQIIDGIRITLNRLFKNKIVTYSEYLFLLASLLVSMTKVSNTAGTYRAYLKKFTFRSKKPFVLYPIHMDAQPRRSHHSVIKNNAFKVAKHQSFDVLYLDPPYNHCHYGSYYSLLNYVCIYNPKAKIKGVAGTLSTYNKSAFAIHRLAYRHFEKLLRVIKTKWLFLSYSSDGILKLVQLKKLLLSKGNVVCYKILHPRYKSNHNGNHTSPLIEYVFAVDCQRSQQRTFREQWVDLKDMEPETFHATPFDRGCGIRAPKHLTLQEYRGSLPTFFANREAAPSYHDAVRCRQYVLGKSSLSKCRKSTQPFPEQAVHALCKLHPCQKKSPNTGR